MSEGANDASGAYLELKADGASRRIELGLLCQIGRTSGNHLVLAEELVSRKHAMIQRTTRGEYLLTDLGSRNGSFLNGSPVAGSIVLCDGDRIAIGNHEFLFRQTVPVRRRESMSEAGETQGSFSIRTISVLVVDVRGFTALSRRTDPTTLSRMIDAFLRETGAALERAGAAVQQYIGDAVMAMWMHENIQPENEEIMRLARGVAAAGEIAAGLQERFGLPEPIQVGAGINTGLASVGKVGSGALADHTALGETVNVAFRLESVTREIPCDIALGASMHLLIHPLLPQLEFQEHAVRLKGYEEVVKVYGTSFAAVRAALGR